MARGDREPGSGIPSGAGETGGTLAGEAVDRGSVLKGGPSGDEDRPTMSRAPDATGREIAVAPELAGTVAGNTTGAGGTVLGTLGEEEVDEENPALKGVTVQEVGGEGRR